MSDKTVSFKINNLAVLKSLRHTYFKFYQIMSKFQIGNGSISYNEIQPN